MTQPPFEAIVEAHSITVLRVCRAVVGPQDADDAWAETFLAALVAYPTLPPDTNLQAWLVTVAHRKAIDILREQQRSQRLVDQLDQRTSDYLGVTASEEPGARHLDLWDAVAALPTKQRQSIAYHYVGGLPYAEIASLLKVTPEAARRSASDGIAKLRTSIALFETTASRKKIA